MKTTHAMVEKSGGKMQLFYTLGEYDFVMVCGSSKRRRHSNDTCSASAAWETSAQERLRRGHEAEGANLLTTASPINCTLICAENQNDLENKRAKLRLFLPHSSRYLQWQLWVCLLGNRRLLQGLSLRSCLWFVCL